MLETLQQQLRHVIEPQNMFPNEPMRKHTTFAIGGPADLLVKAYSEEDVIGVLSICAQNNTPCMVMGNGSNMLVSDNGIEGVVLKLSKGFGGITVNEHGEIWADSGATLRAVADAAYTNSLCGLEFAAGIPGSLGGALFMNAGAYGGEMKDVVNSVRLLSKEGDVTQVSCRQMEFGYRHSAVQENGAVILGALLKLTPGSKQDIYEKTADLNAQRARKQPLDRHSAGSTFKRPEGHFAGKLIMDCGLRGYTIGGAQVSEKHCGFIINAGSATAKDVMELICHVKERVYTRFNVVLEEEIKVIGRACL